MRRDGELLFVGVFEGVLAPIGISAGIFPGDVLSRIRIERGLVDPSASGVEKVPEVRPEKVPRKVVRNATVIAIDDQTPISAGLQKLFEGVEIMQVIEYILALGGAERLGPTVIFGVQSEGRVGRITGKRVERLIVHPFTVAGRALSCVPLS